MYELSFCSSRLRDRFGGRKRIMYCGGRMKFNLVTNFQQLENEHCVLDGNTDRRVGTACMCGVLNLRNKYVPSIHAESVTHVSSVNLRPDFASFVVAIHKLL